MHACRVQSHVVDRRASPGEASADTMRIRDPIHGTLPVSDEEKAVVDSACYQRLRHVRQLGFGELAFPGATHTRHAHSLGAMHVAARLFDARRRQRATCPRASAIGSAPRCGWRCSATTWGTCRFATPASTSPPRERRCSFPLAGRGTNGGAGHARGLHREAPPGQRAHAELLRRGSGRSGITAESLAALVTGRDTARRARTSRTGARTGRRCCGRWSPASWTRTGWTTCSATRSTRA